MTYVFRLGFKNVFRQRLRSVLTIVSIALSVALVILGTSLMEGVKGTIFSDALAETGEVVVARRDYFEKLRFNPLKYSLDDDGELSRRLASVPGVRAAVPRIDFGFLAEHDERSLAIAVVAVPVEGLAGFSKVGEHLVAGRFLEPGEKGVLVGRMVAEELGVSPGDEVTAVGRTVYDSFMADGFTVVGVFDLGTKLLNRRVFMPLAPAQEFLEMNGGASKVVLYGADYRRASELAAAIRAAGVLPADAEVRPWTEDVFLGGVYALLNAVGLSISAIICFVAGLGIFNMMMVAVMERRKEMGVLMALGTPRLGIVLSFLCEAAVYGLFGGVLGVVLGTPMALWLDRVGIDFRIDEIEGLPLPVTSTIHGDLGPESVLLGLMIGVLLAVLGAAGPLLKTFSMGPQDAMTR